MNKVVHIAKKDRLFPNNMPTSKKTDRIFLRQTEQIARNTCNPKTFFTSKKRITFLNWPIMETKLKDGPPLIAVFLMTISGLMVGEKMPLGRSKATQSKNFRIMYDRKSI